MSQMSLFDAVVGAYADGQPVTNQQLYARLLDAGCVSREELGRHQPVGREGKTYSLAKRKIRWMQQTLRELGVLQRVQGQRGVWAITRTNQPDAFELAPPNLVRVAFSTEMGLALWADASAFSRISTPLHLILTSPPYALRTPRAYGGPDQTQYVDFLCKAIEPLVRNLVAGGSLCLNLSNDIFCQGSPARSTYLERVIIAMEDRLSLKLMDRIIWENPSKPPGPTIWACRQRVQLVHKWEPVLWFCNDPARTLADNRRVLRPHTETHQQLLRRGGEQREAIYGDGAYRLRPGSFGAETPGSIPGNILRIPHDGARAAPLRRQVAAEGLPMHSAVMPRKLARFLIEFLTPPQARIADPFSGWATVPEQAEEAGREWISTERVAQYVAAQAIRMSRFKGFKAHFELTGGLCGA